jgi:hypothetical protein
MVSWVHGFLFMSVSSVISVSLWWTALLEDDSLTTETRRAQRKTKWTMDDGGTFYDPPVKGKVKLK